MIIKYIYRYSVSESLLLPMFDCTGLNLSCYIFFNNCIIVEIVTLICLEMNSFCIGGRVKRTSVGCEAARPAVVV